MHASRRRQPRLSIALPRRRLDARARARPRPRRLRGSRPVRVGNGAVEQLQLDVYGGLLDAALLYARRWPSSTGDTGREVAEIADYVARVWREPDSGIWEVRDAPTHLIQSIAMCWVALDRAVAARGARRDPRPPRPLARGGRGDPRTSSTRTAGTRSARTYMRFPGMRGARREPADARRSSPATSRPASACSARSTRVAPRARRTGRSLPLPRRGRLARAARRARSCTCSFWLADALARGGRARRGRGADGRAGRPGERRRPLRRGDRPGDGAFLGNFPQALTHLALVNAAVRSRSREASR